MRVSIRQLHRLGSALLLAASLLLLAACTAPPTNGAGQGNQPAPQAGEPARPAPATPAPAPEQPSPATPAPPTTGGVIGAQPVQLDTSCKVDADCAVKNVGNCCGYYPACVNVNSPTDPAAVQAECARTGMASVCGFPEISGCQCVQGTCKAQSSGLSEPLQ